MCSVGPWMLRINLFRRRRLVASRQPDFDARPILREDVIAQPIPIWRYSIESALERGVAAPSSQIRWRYGDHLSGSYYQYAGFVFDQERTRYEMGFSLEELNHISQDESAGIIWGVLISALFYPLCLSVVFPFKFSSPS